MTRTRVRELPFLFLVAALDVLAVGYRFLWAYPISTLLGWSVALVLLGTWYARVQRADEEVTRRTARHLVLAMIVFVLVVPFLLGKLVRAS